jgi:hypothetical protein
VQGSKIDLLMSALGHKRKGSERANVVGFAPESGPPTWLIYEYTP